MLAPGPVTSVPLVSGLVGGSQVQSKAQVAAQEETQNQDKAQHEDNPWEGQEQVLGTKKQQHVRQLGRDTSKGQHLPSLVLCTGPSELPPQLTHLRARLTHWTQIRTINSTEQ